MALFVNRNHNAEAIMDSACERVQTTEEKRGAEAQKVGGDNLSEIRVGGVSGDTRGGAGFHAKRATLIYIFSIFSPYFKLKYRTRCIPRIHTCRHLWR